MQINCLYLCMENLKDTKTADLIAEWSLQKAAQPFAYPNKDYFIICETCGWQGSSEECGEHFYGDDSEAYCGNCGNTKLKDSVEFDADRFSAIATELDMRCVEAGISIVDGLPTFVCIIRESVVSRGIPFTTIAVDVEAAELHALLGWLLLKEGGNNG